MLAGCPAMCAAPGVDFDAVSVTTGHPTNWTDESHAGFIWGGLKLYSSQAPGASLWAPNCNGTAVLPWSTVSGDKGLLTDPSAAAGGSYIKAPTTNDRLALRSLFVTAPYMVSGALAAMLRRLRLCRQGAKLTTRPRLLESADE